MKLTDWALAFAILMGVSFLHGYMEGTIVVKHKQFEVKK